MDLLPDGQQIIFRIIRVKFRKLPAVKSCNSIVLLGSKTLIVSSVSAISF